MTENSGPKNKQFDEQIKKYERAFVPGTKEYEHRRNYPGEAAKKHVCTNNECINFESPITETYWLCENCTAVAPDTIYFLRNAPYKVNPPASKRKHSNAASFAVWCLQRKRATQPKKAGKKK